MSPTKPQPTLLVFTLGADRDAVRHPVMPPSLRDQEVATRRAWLHGALEAGRQAHCRLEVSTPTDLDLPQDVLRTPQEGGTFGQRLVRAMDRATQQGRGPVVVVGADSPGFGAQHIRQALALLEANPRRVVLGPASDGGVYLIATAVPCTDLAEGVTWCHRHTLRSLRRVLRELGLEIVELETLTDIDDPSAFTRWLRVAGDSWRSLVGYLRARLASTLCPPCPHRLGATRDPAIAPLLARGPPAAA